MSSPLAAIHTAHRNLLELKPPSHPPETISQLREAIYKSMTLNKTIHSTTFKPNHTDKTLHEISLARCGGGCTPVSTPVEEAREELRLAVRKAIEMRNRERKERAREKFVGEFGLFGVVECEY